jgi:hypothetical protein
MGAVIRYSQVQRRKITKDVCSEFSKGVYTIQSCCDKAGVPYNTFARWASVDYVPEKGKKPPKGFVQEVQRAYKKAKEVAAETFKSELREHCRAGLLKRVQGFTYTETQTEIKTDGEGQPKPVMIRKTEKTVLPDVTALIFCSKNVDEEMFKDVIQQQHSGNVGIHTTGLEEMSDTDLAEMEQRLLNELGGRDAGSKHTGEPA